MASVLPVQGSCSGGFAEPLRALREQLFVRLQQVAAERVGLAAVNAHTERVLESLAEAMVTASPPPEEKREDEKTKSTAANDAALEALLAKARRTLPLDEAVPDDTALGWPLPRASNHSHFGGRASARDAASSGAAEPAKHSSGRAMSSRSVPSLRRASAPASARRVPATSLEVRQRQVAPTVDRNQEKEEVAAAMRTSKLAQQTCDDESQRAVEPPFDVDRWRQWRQAQATYLELKASEIQTQQAAGEAQAMWRQRLASSASSCSGSTKRHEGPAAQLLGRACSLAELCQVAADEALPAPSAFLDARGLLPLTRHDGMVEASEETELERLFLMLALGGWASRLAAEADAIVPAASLVAHALRRSVGACRTRQKETVTSESASASGFTLERQLQRSFCSEDQQMHPVTLLRHLPTQEAVRSVVLATHRGAHIEAEGEIAGHCCAELLGRVNECLQSHARLSAPDTARSADAPSPLAPAVLDALQVMRLSEHLCSEERAMASFWRLPSSCVSQSGASVPLLDTLQTKRVVKP